jgi:hypothetical protein
MIDIAVRRQCDDLPDLAAFILVIEGPQPSPCRLRRYRRPEGPLMHQAYAPLSSDQFMVMCK